MHMSTGASGHIGEIYIICIYALFWGTHLQVRPVDKFLQHDGSNDADLRPSGICSHGSPFRGSNPQKTILAWMRVFKPNSWNWKTWILSKLLYRSIPTKFCTVMKTTEFPTHTSQSKVADGRHLGKIGKSPYLSHGTSDFDEIWHSGAVWPSLPFWPLKIWNFKNPWWRQPPSWKIEKLPYLGRDMSNFNENWHGVMQFDTLDHSSQVCCLQLPCSVWW